MGIARQILDLIKGRQAVPGVNIPTGSPLDPNMGQVPLPAPEVPAPQVMAAVPEPTQMPEPPAVAAPIQGDPGPSLPVPAAAVPPQSPPPAARKRGGVLGALESVFAPDPGTFWHSALNNGLINAKQGMIDYQRGEVNANVEAASKARAAADLAKYGEVKVTPTGDVIRVKDGVVTPAYVPARKPGEKETLIEMWKNAPEGSELQRLIGNMLVNFGNTAEGIAAKGAAATSTAVARANAVGANRPPPKAGAAGSGQYRRGPTGQLQKWVP